ncbi:hypothetical protein LTR84_005140 [Exophiala bonariae]|uniref:Calcineurin-like phosphoesterase domain-containing protein n=1 Tax=Exophiala bonariae TaxID=1690606 RepID=A0AAV9NSE5_9EURO|nr:hypothetical protein LTR84_005140 [Exophiala bonariae]
MASSTFTQRVRTRILIISDTHCALPRPSDNNTNDDRVPFQYPLPTADVLVHCGDLTSNGRVEQHLKALELINSISAELKIVIPGNHDLTLDRAYYDRYPNEHCGWHKYSDDVLREIKDMYESEKTRERGIRYLEEGTASFTLKSGARLNVYASGWQPEFCNWAFGYSRDHDRYNRPLQGGSGPGNPVPDFDTAGGGVDIMITHGPPKGLLDRTVDGMEVGCEHLLEAVRRCRPLVHCFGHIHEGWGALVKDWDVAERPLLTASEDTTDEVLESSMPPSCNTDTPDSIKKREKDVTVPDYEEQARQRGVFVDATGLKHGKETLFVNASIMTHWYKPLQAPWIVDVDLPMAT